VPPEVIRTTRRVGWAACVVMKVVAVDESVVSVLGGGLVRK